MKSSWPRHGFCLYRIVVRIWLAIILGGPAWSGTLGAHSVLDYGAAGDGATLDTSAIQAAIDACSNSGGGTVLVPAGRYLTGTIFLKDNVRLHLEPGAVILASTELAEYPVLRCDYPSRSDAYTARALIWAEGVRNVAITGFGTIDGQGAAFKDREATEEEMAAHAAAYAAEGRFLPEARYFNRPYVIRLIGCRDIVVEDVTLRDSAMWMQQYLNCEYVTVRGIKVFNHVAKNNDMIDIDGCRYVTITDCIGDTSDDALTLKSTGAAPTAFVTITNCILSSHCNALKAGTESAGGFNDITISNCVIKRSAVDTVIAGRREGLAGIALEIVDGGTLDSVAISNITIEGTTAPIFLRLGNRGRAPRPADPGPPVGRFRNVIISNVVARGASKTGCAIAGIPGHPVENIILENIRMSFAGGGTADAYQRTVPEVEAEYPESTMFGTLPAYGLFVRHAQDVTLRNLHLSFETQDARPAVVFEDVHRARVEALEARAADDAPAVVAARQSSDIRVDDGVKVVHEP